MVKQHEHTSFQSLSMSETGQGEKDIRWEYVQE